MLGNQKRIKTRVLYIDEVSQIGGGGNSLNYLMRYLDKERFEPMLITLPGHFSKLAEKANIRTLAYTFRKRYLSIPIGNIEISVNPYRLLYRFVDALKIIQIIRREKVAIVHTNNLDAHLTGWFLNKIYRIPVIWHIRTIWPSSFYKVTWPSRIIFVSQAVKEKALGSENSDSRALVIYNGIDPEDFVVPDGAREAVITEFSLPHRPIVGIVGRLDSWKRHDLFLKAAALLKNQGVDASWMIVGGDYKNRYGETQTDYLKKLSRQLQIEDRVIFTGLRHDISRLVGSFDVFVSASDDDPNPRVVLEAMAMARPIVGTNSGGVPEMLDNGRCAIMIQKGNEEALAQGILQLLQEPAYAMKLGQLSRRRVEDFYSIQQHVRQVEEVYDSILNNIYK